MSKIIFFGLGSIGKRHVKIINNNYNHELFAFRSDKKNYKNFSGVQSITSWEKFEKIRPCLNIPKFLTLRGGGLLLIDWYSDLIPALASEPPKLTQVSPVPLSDFVTARISNCFQPFRKYKSLE